MATFLFVLLILIAGCSPHHEYDVLIRNGRICDGTGAPMFVADLGIIADSIAYIGDLRNEKGSTEIDADGLVVAPGFINMLSWANESLLEDGRSQSDIRQGVTLEVLGEGVSMGPLNDRMKAEMKNSQTAIQYEITWTTLGEYLDHLADRGISPNVASFVGATTLREYLMGYEDRAPTPQELDSMRLLLRQAMEEGAVGLSSALQYVPASFASTDELISLCKEAARYDGLYISHLRDEGEALLPSLDEFLRVASESGIRAEIYHLKQSGRSSWTLIDPVIWKIDSARSAGKQITADMYNYVASWTGFDILMPAWVQEGGFASWAGRLADPSIRAEVGRFIRRSILQKTGSADNILITGLRNDSLKYLTGKTLAEIARIRAKTPEETVMDLVLQDRSRVEVVYFSMSEKNVKRQITLPWMSFCSDAASDAPEGVFLRSSVHPRAYGNFARLLGKYVREEKVISLEEAVRRLTSLPASNLKISRRGSLKTGYYADLVIFDADKIRDNATFEEPRKYATGVVHVLVNGVPVINKGEHTGAKPGRVVRGPGWKTE